MADGYWVTRKYQAGPIGETIKFWVPGRRPEKRGGIRKDRSLRKAAQHLSDAVKTVARLLNANFHEGDIILSLDYSDKALDRLRSRITGWDAMSMEDQIREEWIQARRECQRFIQRLKYRADKQGLALRYISITSDMDGETGETKRVHHHLFVNREARDLVMDAWTLGGVDYEPISAQPDYTPIASYLIRQVRHIEDAKKYVSSRNLVRPEPKDRVAAGPAVIRPPKGALLVDAGKNIPGQPQYIRYVMPDAAEAGEQTLRNGVKGLKVSDWHRRITPGMKHAMEGEVNV